MTDLKKTDRKKLIVIIVLSLLTGGIFLSGAGVYVGGWEVQSDIYDITADGIRYPVMATALQPENTYVWGSKGITFDTDDEMFGTGNIGVGIGGPSEKTIDAVSGGWRDTIGTEVYATYQKNIGEVHYFWDHHVFMFDVQIICKADFTDYTTALFFQWTEGEAQGMTYFDSTATSKESILNVKINFKTDPWVNAILEQIADNDSIYVLDEESIWTGIMSAQIVSGGIESEFIGWPVTAETPLPPYGKIDPYQSGGAQLSLFTEYEGSYSPTAIDPDNLPQDKPIDMAPDKVQIELGMGLWAGWSREQGGSTKIYPAQLTYTLRFDVLSTAGYQLIDGDLDDELDDNAYKQGQYAPLSAFFAVLEGIFAGQLMPLLMIVIVILALWFGMKLLTAITAGRKVKQMR